MIGIKRFGFGLMVAWSVLMPGVAQAALTAATPSVPMAIIAPSLAPQTPPKTPAITAPSTQSDDLHAIGLLPSGRVNVFYRTTIVRGGPITSYVYDQKDGIPPGLAVTENGYLVGLPSEPGSYHLQLAARDVTNPASTVRVAFSLRILPQAPAQPIKLKTPKPNLTSEPTKQLPVPLPDGQIAIYQLTVSDLAALDKPPAEPDVSIPAPGTSSVSAVAAGIDSNSAAAVLLGGLPTAASLLQPATPPVKPAPSRPLPVPVSAALQPILDIEYPNQALFKAAVDFHINHAVPPVQLDTARLDAVESKARKIKKFEEAVSPTWTARPGCGCVLPLPQAGYRTVYGILPFWQAGEDGNLTVDFSTFDRIGFLGAQISHDGHVITPSGGRDDPQKWWLKLRDLAHVANAHGTKLDLVVQRSDWSALPTDPDKVRDLASIAATQLVHLSETPLSNFDLILNDLLLGFWRNSDYIFDGITLLFTPPPANDPAIETFRQFMQFFMPELIDDMRAERRRSTLTIALNDDKLCKSSAPEAATPDADACNGPLNLSNMVKWKARAEAPVKEPFWTYNALTGADGTLVTMEFLVLMRESVQENKKALRARIDSMQNDFDQHEFEGQGRVELQHRIIPLVFEPSGNDPSPTKSIVDQTRGRLVNDIAYFAKNFGGAGAWPTVPRNLGTTDAFDAVVAGNWRSPEASPWQLFGMRLEAPFVPPWLPHKGFCNIWLRLAWQASVLLLGTVAIVYFSAALSQRMRSFVFMALVVSLVLMLGLGFWLLQTDPALDLVRSGNIILYGLVGALAVAAAWFWSKPRVRDP